MLKSLGNGGDPEVEDTGLLDGGTTHPLRQGTSDEIKNAEQVTVELAHGAAQLYQNPMNGTLLSEGPVEPIVPLRGLAELGFTITWSRAGCAVKHPRLGKIKCWERSGCPVVRRNHALALITEIERMDTEKRNDRRFMREKTNKVSTKISRFKKEPADEPAGREPGVCSKASTFCISRISGQDDQGSGEAPAKEVGSPNSGEFIVRKSAWNINKTGRPNFQVWIRNKINKCTLQGQDPQRGLYVLKNINRKKVNKVGMKTFRGKNLWPICCQRSSL